uniref:Uncharacterized protein n=1 Tax=Anopheles farauti TaxID=69004 RepID=A0A182QLJ4_9DIPT
MAVGWIVQLVTLLPDAEHDRTQPDRQHHDQLRQVEGEKLALVLAQPVVDAQPEHEYTAQERRLQQCVDHPRQPVVGDEDERKDGICSNVLLNSSNSGSRSESHFCSIDQSAIGYLRSVWANQHVMMNVNSTKMNRNQISICVKAGLYDLRKNCTPVELHRDDVVRVVEEADVEDGKLVALLVAARQVPGAVLPVGATIVRPTVHRHRFVVRVQALDQHVHVELLVHHLVVRVVRRQLRDDPQLLRVGRQERRVHHERTARQVRAGKFLRQAAPVRLQRASAHLAHHRDGRPGQPDEDAEPEAGEERQKDGRELALVHRVQAHMDGPLAAVVMVGRGDVLVKLAEQVAKLGETLAQPETHPGGRNVAIDEQLLVEVRRYGVYRCQQRKCVMLLLLLLLLGGRKPMRR